MVALGHYKLSHISYITAQKMKFSVKDFFSKCDQIRSFLRIWLHLLKKSLMEKLIFCTVGGLKWIKWNKLCTSCRSQVI